MRLLLILSLLVGACAAEPVETIELESSGPTNPVVSPVPGTDDAAAFVWGALKGSGHYPRITWMAGDCLDGVTFQDDKPCHSGLFTLGFEIYLLDKQQPIHESSLAHELLHARLQQQYGDADALHTRSEWQLVPVLNEYLAHKGL